MAYSVVFALALFLLFYHLDNRLLWGDEAETALLAKNILRFGIPKTMDGVNHIDLVGHFRDENAAHIWTWSPWLQEYLVAGMYALFGVSTWTSRVIFAAVGWFCVILLARVAYRIYRDHRVALGSAFLLATSEIFLLHSRQCRYYSVIVFGEILLVYGAFELLANHKRAVWLISSALILQFYANFIVAVANLPLLIALAWFTRKERQPLIKLATAIGLFGVATLPWLTYAPPWEQSKVLRHDRLVTKALGYFIEWNFHFVPWVLLLLPVAVFFIRARPPQLSTTIRIKSLEQSLSILVVGYLVILLLPPLELRYLLPLLPVGCLLVSTWLFRYVPWSSVAVVLIVIQSATNIIPIVSTFGLSREHTWRVPLIQFVRGINQNYADRFTDLRTFFLREAQPGQSVLVRDPEFPLIFYTGLKIIDGRFEQPDSPPDWILPQSASGLFELGRRAIPETLEVYYDSIVIRVHDSDRFDNVPEPDRYQYNSTEKMTDFVVYRKKM